MILPALASCGHNDDDTTEISTLTTDGTPDAPASVETIGGYGIETFSIVIPADAAKEVSSAAYDMASLIGSAVGYVPPVVTDAEKPEHGIILDVTSADTDAVKAARAEVKNDGYALLEENGNLYITGAIPKGTSNGVYDFLQNYLGVRFYCGTFTHFRADGIKNVGAGEKIVFNPVFLYRNNYCVEVMMNINNYTARTMGYGTLTGVGAPHNLGNRSNTGGPYSAQPCLSDPAVYEATLQSLCSDIEKYPDADYFNVCQNDGAGFCRCDECKAKYDAAGGTDMGPLLLFINQLARDVKERYPDRDISILTLAYQDSTQAPDPDYVVPEDNVIIQLCMMNSTCFTHAFSDPDCSMNSVSYANILAWSKVCKKLFVWDYSYNHASYEAAVGPNLDVLWDNMQMYRDCNFIGQFQQSAGVETGEFVELRSYLIGRLLWNPNISREEYQKLYDEFMEDYYGDAAPYLKEYIDLLNESSRRTGLTAWNGHTSVYTDMSVFFVPKVDNKKSTEVIDKCTELWDKALACQLDDVTFAHVEKSSITYLNAAGLYTGDRALKKKASGEYKALCDKYTYDWDNSLPSAGPTEGFSTEIPSEGLEYRSYADGSLYVSDVGDFRAGMLVIPSEHDGKKVTGVGQSAFSRADTVVELHVKEGVTYIGKYAFRACVNLKAVYLPASLQVLEYGALGIGAGGYYSNDALTDIYYAGTTGQWNALYAAYNGAANCLKDRIVHCADGDITY